MGLYKRQGLPDSRKTTKWGTILDLKPMARQPYPLRRSQVMKKWRQRKQWGRSEACVILGAIPANISPRGPATRFVFYIPYAKNNFGPLGKTIKTGSPARVMGGF